MSFSRQAIDHLIRWAKLPVLPSDRPKLLIWIVRDDPLSGRQFIDSQILPEFTELFDSLMQERGMPYRLPDFDLEDQLALSVNEAWGLQERAIEAASTRYNAEGWVLLRFFTTATVKLAVPGCIALQMPADLMMFEQRTANSLCPGGQRPCRQFLSLFTYIPQTDTSQLVVQVNQVDSYKDYQSVISQLQKLELVQSWSCLPSRVKPCF